MVLEGAQVGPQGLKWGLRGNKCALEGPMGVHIVLEGAQVGL